MSLKKYLKNRTLPHLIPNEVRDCDFCSAKQVECHCNKFCADDNEHYPNEGMFEDMEWRCFDCFKELLESMYDADEIRMRFELSEFDQNKKWRPSLLFQREHKADYGETLCNSCKAIFLCPTYNKTYNLDYAGEIPRPTICNGCDMYEFDTDKEPIR